MTNEKPSNNQDDEKADRLARELRSNLAKRKALTRTRKARLSPETPSGTSQTLPLPESGHD
jgi:hypothetical protein